MSDTSYQIEIVPASKNSWFTPSESNAYYAARYARNGVTLHWWGGGETADKHDSIVNYLVAQADRGIKSANYVLSDNKITLMVNPDNVAWCSEGGNPTTISIECQPTLSDEGYKKLGWLIEQLEQRYGHQLELHRHSDWFSTACPGTISVSKVMAEVDKWRNKVYDQPPVSTPAPVPTVPPVPAEPTLTVLHPSITMYTKPNAKLVNIKDLSVVKTFDADTPIEIGASGTLNGFDFLVSRYAFEHTTKQGFLKADLKDAPTPSPTPEPPANPDPDPATSVDTPDSTEPTEDTSNLDDLDYGNLDMDHDPAPQTSPTPETPAPAVLPPTQVIVAHNLKATILTAITAVMAAVAALLAWLHS